MNKKWGKTSLSSGLVLAMLIPGLACQSGEGENVEQLSEDNEFGVLLEGLGDDITDCTDADTALAGGVLTLDLGANEDAVVSVVGGKLKVNGRQCKTDATAGTDILVTAAPKLVINTTAANTNKIVFDLLPGDFGALIGASGGITINIPNTAVVSVGVRGTDGVNNFKMAQEENPGTDLFVDLNNNGSADIKVDGDPSSVVFTLAGGADAFNGTDSTAMTFGGASQAVRAVQTEPLTVYGGAGADTLEGGLGDDTLNGGDQNDLFTMLSTGADGNDTYIGGLGTDTVDYSNRDAGVRVDVAPLLTNAYVDGERLYGATLTGETLDITIGGGNLISYTAGTVIGITEFLADLNAALTTEATASVDDHGHLRITAALVADSILIGTNTLGIAAATYAPGRADDADDGEIGTAEADDVRNDIENLKGSAHDDFLTGSQFANVIDGNAGDDSLSGGAGGTCTGNNGPDVDTLNGGADDDTFPMGSGTNCGDVVDGGAGIDTVSYERRTNVLNVTLDNTANDGEGTGSNSEADNLKTVEVLLGGTNNDNLTGGTGNDEIHGGPGNDVIKGGAGNDILVGNVGGDSLQGEAGDDFIDEASAVDTKFETTTTPPDTFSGVDTLHGGVGFNTCDFNRGLNPVTATDYTLCFSATTSGCTGSQADGADGDDVINCSHIKLDGGVDNVTGSTGDDTVEAGDGDDVLDGGNGNDTLYGEAGDDTVNGNAGFDMLDGGDDQTAGVLDGGSEDDICVSPAAVPTVSCEQ